MARIVHLSDLHFGAHDPRLVAAVEVRVDDAGADLVVISGDFTQRARTEQFEEACHFLTRLRNKGHEVIAVPGNHDVPLYDVLRRFLSPLTRYRRFIDDELCPFHELKDAAVLGINTARSLTFKDGRINAEQVEHIRSVFAKVASDTPRILVTHHPLFALPVSLYFYLRLTLPCPQFNCQLQNSASDQSRSIWLERSLGRNAVQDSADHTSESSLVFRRVGHSLLLRSAIGGNYLYASPEVFITFDCKKHIKLSSPFLLNWYVFI